MPREAMRSFVFGVNGVNEEVVFRDLTGDDGLAESMAEVMAMTEVGDAVDIMVERGFERLRRNCDGFLGLAGYARRGDEDR